jgi:hypothetical protein
MTLVARSRTVFYFYLFCFIYNLERIHGWNYVTCPIQTSLTEVLEVKLMELQAFNVVGG